jgi:hypothetical protein
MLKTLILITPILAISLSGCISDPLVGKGPIKLSPNTQAGFEEYQKEFKPGHFAVAVDGGAYSYNYCRGRCTKSSKMHSIHRCEQYSDGVPCKIYGAKGKVVWERDAGANS